MGIVEGFSSLITNVQIRRQIRGEFITFKTPKLKSVYLFGTTNVASHVRGSANSARNPDTDIVAMTMNVNGPELERTKGEQLALNDLLEVEACLRDMLKTTSDPAVLQRLFNLHREIQRYVAEVNPTKK